MSVFSSLAVAELPRLVRIDDRSSSGAEQGEGREALRLLGTLRRTHYAGDPETRTVDSTILRRYAPRVRRAEPPGGFGVRAKRIARIRDGTLRLTASAAFR